MAKKTHSTGAKNCTCSKCGVEAHSIPDKQHRRCSGQHGTPPRLKGENLPSVDRGKWQ